MQGHPCILGFFAPFLKVLQGSVKFKVFQGWQGFARLGGNPVYACMFTTTPKIDGMHAQARCIFHI